MLEFSTLREAVCLLGGVLGCLVGISSWMAFVGAVRAKRNYSFMSAAVFSTMGAFSLLLHPSPDISALFWVPIAIDPTWVAVVAVLVARVREK